MSLLEVIKQTVTSSEDDGEQLEIGEIGVLLKNERRRLVVDVVSNAEEPVTIRKLSEIIASAQHEKPIDLLGSDERKRVYVAIYQTHLPNLDEMGIVDYNAGRGLITEGDAFGHAERVLETVRGECGGNGGGGA